MAGGGAVLFDHLDEIDAAAIGQLHIQQVRIGAARVGVLAELGHALTDVDGVAFALQDHAQRAPDILFIIHDQDALGCH